MPVMKAWRLARACTRLPTSRLPPSKLPHQGRGLLLCLQFMGTVLKQLLQRAPLCRHLDHVLGHIGVILQPGQEYGITNAC